mgnify:CR=1 FL=1
MKGLKGAPRWSGVVILMLGLVFLAVGVQAVPSAATPVAEDPVQALPTESPWSSSVPQTGAGVQPAVAPFVIVDNSSPAFHVEAGDWGTCFDGECGGVCYGADFRYAEPGCTSCQARFDLIVPQDGDYDLWAWWPWGEDRATDTPFTIRSSQGELTVSVDQRNNGDGWYWLHYMPLRAGEAVSIIVRGSATGYANADAVGLSRPEFGPPPAPQTTAPMEAGQPQEQQLTEETPSAGEPPVIQTFYSEPVPDRPGCYYLHWDVTGAQSIILNDLPLDPSGLAETCPGTSSEYRLCAENAVGEVEQVLTLSGLEQEVLPTPTRQAERSVLTLQAARPVSIIFLHHSCGANLIEQGGLRERLTALGYAFYDHGYNADGLVLADGAPAGYDFGVPDDNTDPDGFAAIFAQPLHDPPDNTFSHLMQYDVIAFKSCFPVSNIESDEQLAQYKAYYLSIRNRMDQYPDKLFIIVTQPPQVPNNTLPDMTVRARVFANWLASPEFLAGHPNVVTFDFFGLLADPASNCLRPEYRVDEYDAHPNELANRTIAPLFVDFIAQAATAYFGAR